MRIKFHFDGRRIKRPVLGWVKTREKLRFTGKPFLLRSFASLIGMRRHDRDINAAKNLQRYAPARASRARSHACGEEGSNAADSGSVKPASMKQESGLSYLGRV